MPLAPSSAFPSAASALQFKFQQGLQYPFLGQVHDLEILLINDAGRLYHPPPTQGQGQQHFNDIPFTLHLKFHCDGDTLGRGRNTGTGAGAAGGYEMNDENCDHLGQPCGVSGTEQRMRDRPRAHLHHGGLR